MNWKRSWWVNASARDQENERRQSRNNIQLLGVLRQIFGKDRAKFVDVHLFMAVPSFNDAVAIQRIHESMRCESLLYLSLRASATPNANVVSSSASVLSCLKRSMECMRIEHGMEAHFLKQVEAIRSSRKNLPYRTHLD